MVHQKPFANVSGKLQMTRSKCTVSICLYTTIFTHTHTHTPTNKSCNTYSSLCKRHWSFWASPENKLRRAQNKENVTKINNNSTKNVLPYVSVLVCHTITEYTTDSDIVHIAATRYHHILTRGAPNWYRLQGRRRHPV